jgi:hypothetical protein
VIDDATADLGGRRGVWMGDARVMIHLVVSIIEQAERCLSELVAEARVEDRCGWEDIGLLLGISAEQAWARFAAESAAADRRWLLDVQQ